MVPLTLTEPELTGTSPKMHFSSELWKEFQLVKFVLARIGKFYIVGQLLG